MPEEQGAAHSIWLRPERAGRGPAPEYGRDRIADAGVALADADGLAAVTMRAVALALGAGPASLYRYVATRDELLELMADRANAGIRYSPGTGDWLADLLELARQSRRVYLAHPWLLDLLSARTPLGPQAVRYLEHALAALSGLDGVAVRTRMEAVGMLGAVVAALARAEAAQRLTGRTLPQWQAAQAEYLGHVVATGEHPHLAAALAGAAQEGRSRGEEPPEALFDRVVTRVLTGLLG
ncbi:TetR/AcrR family transcriptional regulator [Streptacidiphilus cavernicola]|uniref:TetR/AcrR family transcriptional regulator n=1 Tax=Streptacidiphilus cavernicola TaxID=3342716 RepID=A0ABV6W0A7_9ACTN